MNKNYRIKVNSFVFEISETEVQALRSQKVSSKRTIINKEHKNYTIEKADESKNTKSGSYWLNGSAFHFEIQNNLDQLVDKMGLTAIYKSLSKEVKSPMPGLVLELLVEEGQSVEKGEQMLILEAMKMENVLLAEQDGVVKSISCKKGDAVEKNQILLSFE